MRRGPVDVGRVLASVVALVGLVVLLPIGLIAVSQARFGSANPFAGVDRGMARRRRIVDAGPTHRRRHVIDGLIRLSLCAAWAAIAVIVVTTVLEAVHMVRHRGLPRPSVRGLGWAQRIARFIAVGLIVLIPLSTPSPSIAMSLSGRATPTLPREVTSTDQARTSVEAEVDRLVPMPDDARPVNEASMVTYVVRPGESVYSIAETLAGADAGSVMDIAESIIDANLDTTWARVSASPPPRTSRPAGCCRSPHIWSRRPSFDPPRRRRPSKRTPTPCSAATRSGTSPTSSSVIQLHGPRSGRTTPATTWVADARSTIPI